MWGAGGGAAFFATAHLSCPRNQELVFASFFPPHPYAGIRPTLFLFRFRADALNSHFPFKFYSKERAGPPRASEQFCLEAFEGSEEGSKKIRQSQSQ